MQDNRRAAFGRIKVILWLALLLLVLHGLLWLKPFLQTQRPRADIQRGQAEPAQEEYFSGFPGERIDYDIKLGSITLGKARFQHLPRVELGGRQVNLMTFETRLARFQDLEKIYSDLKTFLPLRIERDVFIWPAQEKIIEEYDQAGFRLSITKSKGSKKEEMLIAKEGPIHNAILLPFHVRMAAQLAKGFSLKARLPTQEFMIELTALENVTVPAGTFRAFRFQSTPRKFEIWISADERRIPLKIKGSGFMGYTLMMKDYSR